MKQSPLKGKGGREESRHWKLSEKGWEEHQKFDHHKSPLNILSKDGKLLSSAEGGAAYRKSALNMLGISRKKSPLNDMTEQEKAALDAVEAMPDSAAADLGVIKPTERGRSLAAFKQEVTREHHEYPQGEKQHDYFVTNPTEESDEMADKIIAAKKTTQGPMEELKAQGYTSRGQHYTQVEKPLQEELMRKINK